MRIKLLSRIASIGLAFLALKAAACPGCKEAAGGDTSFWASGYNWSIVFMLGTVLSLIGAACFGVWKVARREMAASAGDAASVHDANSYWSKITMPVCFAIVAVLMILGSSDESQKPVKVAYAPEAAVRDEMSKSDGKVLVTFKSEKCKICAKMAPTMKSVESAYNSKVKFVYSNTKESEKLVSEFKVDDLPCSVLFSNGKEVARHAGYASDADLRGWLDEKLK